MSEYRDITTSKKMPDVKPANWWYTGKNSKEWNSFLCIPYLPVDKQQKAVEDGLGFAFYPRNACRIATDATTGKLVEKAVVVAWPDNPRLTENREPEEPNRQCYEHADAAGD